MSEGVGAAADPLTEALHNGMRSDDLPALRTALGVAPDADEAEVARALVQAVARNQRAAAATTPPAPIGEEERTPSRPSQLGWPRGAEGADFARMDDLRTLLAVVRSGTLAQKRAAARRIRERLASGAGGEPPKEVVEGLVGLRRFEIAYEVSELCVNLPGAQGRRARAGRREWDQLNARVEREVAAFWNGELPREPIGALHADQRAQLFVRARDLSDGMCAHVQAVIEGADGTSDRVARRTMLGALQHAGDPRLVPALEGVLGGAEPELVAPAARALGRIEDPRVQSILEAAWERTGPPRQRIAIAGALGLCGDDRGVAYVREVLAGADERLLPRALEALSATGSNDDVQRVAELLDRDAHEIATAAVRALGAIGDGRAIAPLLQQAERASAPALRAEIEEAVVAIRNRIELLGEEPPEVEASIQAFDTAKMAALTKRQDPAWARARARWSQFIGRLWRAVGAHERAIARFEEAAALRPHWLPPVVAIAIAYARADDAPQALAAFRRALGINRREVEQDSTAIGQLARSFLRRAEAMEDEGRDDIAQGLIEEAVALDLRRAPSGLRFALAERLEALRTKSMAG